MFKFMFCKDGVELSASKIANNDFATTFFLLGAERIVG